MGLLPRLTRRLSMATLGLIIGDLITTGAVIGSPGFMRRPQFLFTHYPVGRRKLSRGPRTSKRQRRFARRVNPLPIKSLFLHRLTGAQKGTGNTTGRSGGYAMERLHYRHVESDTERSGLAPCSSVSASYAKGYNRIFSICVYMA